VIICLICSFKIVFIFYIFFVRFVDVDVMVDVYVGCDNSTKTFHFGSKLRHVSN